MSARQSALLVGWTLSFMEIAATQSIWIGQTREKCRSHWNGHSEIDDT